jgi:ferritin-like metal-binding protein YciE
MKDPTSLGHNRTGLQVSPLHGELLTETAQREIDRTLIDSPESTLLAEMRRDYINDAESLGSIPPPATMKGMAKSGAGAITNKRLHVFVDKMAERLAYERGGTRLYDAALVKAIALAEGTPVNIERMKQIRAQEADHANLLSDAIESVGADPTAQTPCADLVGVQAMGLMQSITDPRTSLVQTLSSLLAAELIDVASWELLARLARDMGQDAIANRFEDALAHETQHLDTISRWYEAMVSAEAKMLS